MLSKDRAADVFGIVFAADGSIDAQATAAARQGRAGTGQPMFSFCDERHRQDQVWPTELRRKLASRALDFDLRNRSKLVGYVHRRMMDQGRLVDEALLEDVIGQEYAGLV